MIWSYFLRLDRNSDGVIDTDELAVMIEDIELARGLRPVQRRTLMDMSETFSAANVTAPAVNHFYWSCWDGPFPSSFRSRIPTDDASEHVRNQHWPPIVSNSDLGTSVTDILSTLLSEDDDVLITESLFLGRLAQNAPIGDALLHLLLRKSGPRGLSALLPDPTHPLRPLVDSTLLHYAYSHASLDGRYLMMFEPDNVQSELDLWTLDRPAQFCVNDHMNDAVDTVEGVRSELKAFMKDFFPQPAVCEL